MCVLVRSLYECESKSNAILFVNGT